MDSIISDSLAASREARAAMRVRSRAVMDEAYAKAGLESPGGNVRFQILTKGKAYHILDRVTKAVVGFCFTYRAAQIYADAMERGAAQHLVPRRLNS